MTYYLRVYYMLIKTSLAEITAFRAGFINNIISSALWGTFQFVSIVLLTNRTRSIYGWKREEIILMSACFGIVWGIFHILFGKNFQRLSQTMHKGRLDAILLKPIDSQFLLSTRKINLAAIVRLSIGIGVASYVIHTYHIPVQFINVISFIILVVFALTLTYAIWFLVLTLTVWFTNLHNLVDLLHGVFGISRFPPEIFHEGYGMLFTVLIPLTIVASTPTKALIQRVLLGDIVMIIILSCFFMFLSRKFWKFALRYYTSASG